MSKKDFFSKLKQVEEASQEERKEILDYLKSIPKEDLELCEEEELEI